LLMVFALAADSTIRTFIFCFLGDERGLNSELVKQGRAPWDHSARKDV